MASGPPESKTPPFYRAWTVKGFKDPTMGLPDLDQQYDLRIVRCELIPAEKWEARPTPEEPEGKKTVKTLVAAVECGVFRDALATQPLHMLPRVVVPLHTAWLRGSRGLRFWELLLTRVKAEYEKEGLVTTVALREDADPEQEDPDPTVGVGKLTQPRAGPERPPPPGPVPQPPAPGPPQTLPMDV